MPHRKKVLQLVPAPISQETVDAALRILREAQSADLVGIAWIGIYRRGYMVEAAGAANDRAQLVRGLIPELDELMRERLRLSRRPLK